MCNDEIPELIVKNIFMIAPLWPTYDYPERSKNLSQTTPAENVYTYLNG